MRKYVVFTVVVIGLIMLLIYLYKPKTIDKSIYVITERHVILYEPNQSFGIKYFSETKDILTMDDIEGGFIYNRDASIKFIAEITQIKKIHNERYLDKIHYGYELLLKLPDITDSYTMENLFLNLILKENSLELFAGSLTVEYPEANDNYIDWYGLEGIKSNGPTLSQIIVDLKHEVPIMNVWIGTTEVESFYGLNSLIINVDDSNYVFMTTFVKILTENGVTYLPNFTYFINYELMDSGLHQHYIIL